MLRTSPRTILNYEEHAERLAVNEQGLLRKIKRIYDTEVLAVESVDGGEKVEIKLPSNFEEKLFHETDLAVNTAWQSSCGRSAHFSKIELGEEKQRQLDVTARDVIHDYAKAFYLREVIRKIHPNAPLFDDENNRTTLSDIYINHITCEALSKMASFGFSPRSALSLTGYLVKQTIDHYDRAAITCHMPHACKEVEPVRPDPIESDSDAKERIHEIMDYWHRMADRLSTENKKIKR